MKALDFFMACVRANAATNLRDPDKHDVGLLLAGQNPPKGVRLMPDIKTPSIPKQCEPEKPE